MPRMTGEQFLQSVQSEDWFQRAVVIIVTTSTDPTELMRVKRLGAKEVVFKSQRFTDFVDQLGCIRNYLASAQAE
ncbi:MAG: hypothetical protein KDD62_03710 [Bdellovibrionales bacterium]|nr:hypothetical protein [Bdellovibrionales bacterium]